MSDPKPSKQPLAMPLPEQAPRVSPRFQGLKQWLGRTILRVSGWRCVGEWPNVPHAIFIIAPHTSGWDVVWGLGVKFALNLDMRYMIKNDYDKGILGWFLRSTGAVFINRKYPGGLIANMANQLTSAERRWIIITPEGTRKEVDEWKTGFWRIAKQADVPICQAYFDYPSKTLGIGPLFHVGDDMAADIDEIRSFYQDFRGK